MLHSAKIKMLAYFSFARPRFNKAPSNSNPTSESEWPKLPSKLKLCLGRGVRIGPVGWVSFRNIELVEMGFLDWDFSLLFILLRKPRSADSGECGV